MTPLDKLLARLRELEGRATRGPWPKPETGRGFASYVEIPIEYFTRTPSGEKSSWETPGNMVVIDHGRTMGDPEPDAKLIAESRNALPVLLEIIERQRATLNFYANSKNWVSMTDGLRQFVKIDAIDHFPVGHSEYPSIQTAGLRAKKAIAECDALAEKLG